MLDNNKYVELRAAVMTPTQFEQMKYECAILKLVVTYIKNCERFPSYVKMKNHGNIQSREIYKILNKHPTGKNLHVLPQWYSSMNDIEIIQATTFIEELIVVKKKLISCYSHIAD